MGPLFNPLWWVLAPILLIAPVVLIRWLLFPSRAFRILEVGLMGFSLLFWSPFVFSWQYKNPLQDVANRFPQIPREQVINPQSQVSWGNDFDSVYLKFQVDSATIKKTLGNTYKLVSPRSQVSGNCDYDSQELPWWNPINTPDIQQYTPKNLRNDYSPETETLWYSPRTNTVFYCFIRVF